MSTPLTRRRFIAIAATLAAGVGIPFAISRKTNQPTRPASPNQEEQPVIWRGIALGSGAELRLFGVGRRQAEILINKVLAEVSRLEKNLQPVSGRQPDQPFKPRRPSEKSAIRFFTAAQYQPRYPSADARCI